MTMGRSSKRLQALSAKVERQTYYGVDDALRLVKETASAKFDESVDVAVNLGVNARKSDQNVRGATVLPRGVPSPTAAAHPVSGGPFGYRRERALSAHEQFFMVLLSPRTPSDIKHRLRAWETRVLDGEITPQESQDLQFMYQRFVAV